METLTRIELRLRHDEMLEKVRQGAVFIHPTDTIYGLGCNALDSKAVEKIRKLKERQDTPFSIWVPTIKWIHENCVVDSTAQEWLAKLPGPYTLLIRLKNKNAIARNVSPKSGILGVRLPQHWFSSIVTELGIPIVTTSANKTGQQFMTSLENLDPEIEKGVEFCIYEGLKAGHPSKIVDLSKGTVKER